VGSGKSAKKGLKRSAKNAERLLDATRDWDAFEVRSRQAHDRLTDLHQQLDDVLAALDESSARLQAAAATIRDLPTSAASSEAALELRRRLEQMLLTQQRTNELLDLALGVAMEPDQIDRRLR
jgi:hypothetical protein